MNSLAFGYHRPLLSRVKHSRFEGEEEHAVNIQWKGLRPIQGEVVVVEDDPTLRQLMVDIVVELGASCIAFDNAEDALVHMLSPVANCGLVIADHGVPGSIKGMELAAMVQQKWPGTGFVLTSGYLLDVSGLPPPLVYLLKPWSIDALVVAIAQTLQPGVAIHKVG